jgi:YesN/AraC family two-component response regulator
MKEKSDMKPTLLIVEDDLATREEIRAMVETEFEVVATASGGKEALEKCLLHEPKIVLTDLVMPEFSGMDVAYALLTRKDGKPKPNVFILSGYYEEDLMLKALALGVKDYLQKPVKPQILLGAI